MASGIQLLVDMWAHVGPGLVLALALPVLLIALGLVVLTAARQIRERLQD